MGLGLGLGLGQDQVCMDWYAFIDEHPTFTDDMKHIVLLCQR